MAKMSKAQRIAVLDFHNGVTSKAYTMLVRSYPTLDVMVANGWAVRVTTRTAHVTTAGLLAAGVDIDAIHVEALNVDRMITHNRREHEQARREMQAAADEQTTPAYRRFRAAVLAGKSYRAALDILHAEAVVEDEHVTIRKEAFVAMRMTGRPPASAHETAGVPVDGGYAAADLHAIAARAKVPGHSAMRKGELINALNQPCRWVAEIAKCPRCGLSAAEHIR